MIFKAFWLSAKDLFDELSTLGVANVLWTLINLPLGLLAFLFLYSGATAPGLLVALVGSLPLGLATAGLYTMAERVTEGRVAGWRVFFEGLRTHWKLSMQVYGLWAFGLVLILVNLRFYLGLGSGLGTFLTVLFLYILVVWLALLIYIGPLMLLQTDKRLRIIARNAFVMALGRPIFTLVTQLMMAVIVVVSWLVWILPFLLTYAFLATWSFRATKMLIADAEARRAALEEKKAAAIAGARPANEKGRGGQIRPRD